MEAAAQAQLALNEPSGVSREPIRVLRETQFFVVKFS